MSRLVEFHYKKTKRPKLLENNVFILYSPQKLKFQPGERKIVDMQLKIKFSANITGNCTLLFHLANHGLHLENCNYLTGETNLHLEILNRSMTQTIEVRSKSEIGYFTPDYVAGTEINYKYVKERD